MPTFAETCFQSRLESGYLSLADAGRMLQGVGDSQINRADQNKVAVKGLFRVRDWKPDDVVRLSVGHQGLPVRLYFWCEGQGVVICLGAAGAAYRISQPPEVLRTQQDFRAALGGLVATDDRRDFRLPTGPYQIRCQDGAVVITKGDVRLLTVPLEVSAKSLYIQLPWGGALYELALGRAGPAPDNLTEHRLVLDGSRPDQLPWNSKLPEGASFEKLDDGSVQLSADQNAEPAMATLAGPSAGLYEVIFRIDEATPGTGIVLLDAKGEPVEGIAYDLPQKNKFIFGYATPRESPRMGNEGLEKQPVAMAGGRQWLRLVVAAGIVRCWISGDGRHWGQVLESHDRMGPWRSLALFVREAAGGKKSKTQPARRIRLGVLQVRELDGLIDAAAPELYAKAAGVDAGMQYDHNETIEAWWQRMSASAPAGVSGQAWRYACILRALAAPVRSDFADSMLSRAVRERVEELPSVEAKLRLLEDAALVWRPSSWDSQREMEMWNSVARELLSNCTPTEFERFEQAYMQASFADPQERTGPLSWDLVRDALILFYGERRTAELGRMVRMVSFWQANDPQIGGWPTGQQLDRLLALLNDRPVHKRSHARRGAVDIAAAVAPPVNRAADGILSELQSALDARQFADAARILMTSNPPRGGLAPAPEDDQLFVSFSVALRMLMAAHDGFRDAMNQQIGPADQLKIEQCLARNDAAAMETLALQYYGTTASAPPCQWLGDRALAAADFARAVHWYDEGLRAALPAQEADLAARKRLALAMQGTLAGSPPSRPVALAGEQVPAERFEEWVQTQYSRARRGAPLAMPVDELPLLPLNGSASIERVAFASFNESAGRGYRREDMPGEFYDVDWSWRHLALRAEEDGVFVFHRSRISAFEYASGRTRWTCNLGNAWSPSPGRPLFTARRIYVCAALSPERCGVACLDRATGRRLWLCDCDGAPVSDPISSRGRLFVFAMGRAFHQPTVPLSLVELQPETGEILGRHAITEMTEHVNLPGQCDVACADDCLVATIAGNVLCLDGQGRLLWLRQGSPLTYQIDPGAVQQHSQPPIARGGRLYIQQPGSCVIECLDQETGERRWQRGIVGLRSVAELGSDRLLVHADWGLAVLNKETGEVAWQRAIAGMLTAAAQTTSGAVLTARQTPGGDKQQIEAQWLDAATGQSLGRGTIPLAENRPIHFGPLAIRGDRAWAAFGFGPRDDSPIAENNKSIVELRFSQPITESEAW